MKRENREKKKETAQMIYRESRNVEQNLHYDVDMKIFHDLLVTIFR